MYSNKFIVLCGATLILLLPKKVITKRKKRILNIYHKNNNF